MNGDVEGPVKGDVEGPLKGDGAMGPEGGMSLDGEGQREAGVMEEAGPDPSAIRVVGGDGGGTRLRLALADGQGRILSRRMGPPGLVEPGGEARVAARITDEVRALAKEVGARLPLDAICVGLAGVGRTERARAVREGLEAGGVARRVQVITDAAVALQDAFGSGSGILLIAGTGSVALARHPDGRVSRVGGWGALLGDEGSGYRLALEGLRAGLRGWDGRGPVTAIGMELARAVGAASPEGLLSWSEQAGKGQVAALTPHVIRLAQEGDAVARGLVEEALNDLLAHVEALRGAVGSAAIPVALSGGLLSPGGPLRDAILALLTTRGFPVREGPVDAARGAVTLALEGLSN